MKIICVYGERGQYKQTSKKLYFLNLFEKTTTNSRSDIFPALFSQCYEESSSMSLNTLHYFFVYRYVTLTYMYMYVYRKYSVFRGDAFQEMHFSRNKNIFLKERGE